MNGVSLMSTSKAPYYRIFLLTIWQEYNRDPPDRITWRFRLEDPRSGQQRAFADAATLMSALHKIGSAAGNGQTQEEKEE